MINDGDDLRPLVERQLGGPIPDNRWQALRNAAYGVPDPDHSGAEAVDMGVREAVAIYRNFYGKETDDRANSDSRHHVRSGTASGQSGARLRALAALFVADANQDPDVQRFRAETLGGRRLPILPNGNPDETAVRNWIAEQNDSSGSGQFYVGALLSTRFPADKEAQHNVYKMPETIRDLYRITEWLAKQYNWIKAEATWFVLTGWTPKVFDLRASVRLPRLFPVASRVTLVIDPMTPPDEVRDFYQHIRKDIYQNERIRPLDEKALALAAFTAECADDETATAKVKRWNDKFPQWRYSTDDPISLANFRRDMKQARERLIYPKLKGSPRQ